MLSPLSILSLDQGPKWQEPIETGTPEKQNAAERLFGVMRAIPVRLTALRSHIAISNPEPSRGVDVDIAR